MWQVCACRVCLWGKKAARSSSGKSDGIKTSPAADTNVLNLWSFCVPGQVNPVRGAEECALAPVPCESQIHLRCTSTPSVSPLQTPSTSNPGDKVPFPSLDVGLECNTEWTLHNCHIIHW